MHYCILQGCIPFVVTIFQQERKVGYFVGTIIKRAGINIIGSTNEGLGIAHQGLYMLTKINGQERSYTNSFQNGSLK